MSVILLSKMAGCSLKIAKLYIKTNTRIMMYTY